MGDCQQFTGHLRDVCEGRADMPLAKINRYRAKWGLDPLAEKPVGVTVVRKVVLYDAGETHVPAAPRTGVKRHGCCGKGKRKPAVEEESRPLRHYPESKAKGGAGTELKALLGRIGIKPDPNCLCNARARTMDERGPDWCQEYSELIVDWLEEEATRRKLPFIRAAGKTILWLAIRRARKAKP